MQLEAEFTTEPFQGEGDPPAHATEPLRRAGEAGLDTEFGPLGTTVRGERDVVLGALEPIVRAAFDGGATRITLRVQQIDDDRPGLA